MQEKLAVTTRTRRCCTQSREMLFSLLNLVIVQRVIFRHFPILNSGELFGPL